MIHVFVINNFAGNKAVSDKIRSYLATKDNLRYFIFNTVYAGFEKNIVKRVVKLFEGERLRFYCCGGSGTMRNMLNGFDSFNNVELAFFPCGLTNDFLKCFGDDEHFFNQIDNLIYGKVVQIDYIKTDKGVALNTLSFGMDSQYVSNMEEFRIYHVFGKQIPYVLSLLFAILFCKTRKFRLEIDGKEKTSNITELILGNGCVLGGNLVFTDKKNIQDGEASYFIATNSSGVKTLPILMTLMKNDMEALSKKAELGSCKKFRINTMDNRPLFLNFDGEIVDVGNSCNIEIVPQGLNFVVPKQIRI